MFSELLIAGTLVVNAGAVLNFKLSPNKDLPTADFDSPLDATAEPSIGDKFREFLLNLRYFRIFIGVWNVVLIFFMFILFSG
eukprot:m.141910 g.141910  ORF g.141910 m.141910 type:complete len:82 (+) comp14053_c0_seq11:3846-4091(+)